MIAALVTGLVAGCSSGQRSAEVDVGPTPTRATSPATPTPTATPGVLDDVARARIPKAARAHTPAGAEAFARFYLEQLNKAWTTPDPGLLTPYALPTCKTCANYAAAATWMVDEHLHYDGNPADVGPAAWLPESKRDKVFVQIVNNQLDRRIIREDGSIEHHTLWAAGLNEVELRWTDTSWLVAAVRVAK